jgi:hypothetical protein
MERSIYLLSAIAVLICGLASRPYRSYRLTFLDEYTGDNVGADAVSGGQHATGWSANTGVGSDLVRCHFLDRKQPTLSGTSDRPTPSDHARRAGPGVWIPLDRPRLLRGQNHELTIHRVGDQTLRCVKIREGFGPLGLTIRVTCFEVLQCLS